MDKISIFGPGFIGGNFNRLFPNESIKIPREQKESETNNILYCISTTDNYNVFEDNTLDIKTNLILLMETLDINKKKFGSDMLVTYLSSWFVYGSQDLPITEDSPKDPRGFYSVTKLCAEQLLRSYCETFGIKYLILRLGNVYGSGDKGAGKKKNALQYLIDEMKLDHDIALYGGGEFTRDYLHVDDVCTGIKLCIDKAEPNQAIHVASGIPYKFRDLIYYCHGKLNSNSIIHSMEATPFHKVVQTKDNWLDNAKITALGFKPKYDIWSGLDTILYDK